MASNNNHTNCVEMIARTIDRPSLGASANNNGWTATHRAAARGHTRSLLKLFECGAPMQTTLNGAPHRKRAHGLHLMASLSNEVSLCVR
jgi:hypothetical protein